MVFLTIFFIFYNIGLTVRWCHNQDFHVHTIFYSPIDTETKPHNSNELNARSKHSQYLSIQPLGESIGTELVNPMSACGEREGNGKGKTYPLGEGTVRTSKFLKHPLCL
jgi:hypothetical protein